MDQYGRLPYDHVFSKVIQALKTRYMNLKIAIRNEMLYWSVFFSLLKKFIHTLADLCLETGVCSIANIELGEVYESGGRIVKEAKFEVKMTDGRNINVVTTAKKLEDALSNAFDLCNQRIAKLMERTL